MTNQTPSTSSYNNLSLLGRFLLVLAVSCFTALGFSSLADHERFFTGLSIAIELASAAGIGLAAGYFSRVLLAGRRPILRFMVGLAGILAGLLLLGALTGWQNGIGPLYYNRSTIDWRGLGLFLGAVGCCVIASLAYRNPLRSSLPSSEEEGPVSSQAANLSRQETTPLASTSRRKVIPASKKPAGKSAKRSLVKQKKTAAKKSQKTVSVKPKKPESRAIIRKRSAKKIVIAPVEEHRCPYCLEPVKRNDPRGVVECDICHTLHHADCWAITGTCQVPHYNH